MNGTFGAFGVARLGIYAAQSGLDVTGNNITNINTAGYTRQRLDLVSLSSSASDKYASIYNVRIGQGVLTAGVVQLRDPGLDLQYRNASANVGSASQKLTGLDDIASILDEVGKGSTTEDQDDGVILRQMNDLRDLISKALTNGIDGYDGMIRESADALCTLFNQYAKDLEDLQVKYETQLEQNTTEINNILENIQKLNETIREADIRGDAALELRDERNRLLDQLSGYMKIDVKYSMEDLGAGLEVEKLTVSLGTGDKNVLIDGVYGSKIGINMADPNYNVQLYALRNLDGEKLDNNHTDPVTLGDSDLYGSLQSVRELLTESGEYTTVPPTTDPEASSKRGILYYRKALDNLAQEFAEQMNLLNAQTTPPDQPIDGAGVLFSNSSTGSDSTGITAGNISVSKDWNDGVVSMVASRDPSAGSGDNSNLAAFLNLFNKKQEFDPGAVVPGSAGAGTPYRGTFEDMLLHIQSTLAEDQMSTTAVLTNYTVTQNELYTNRESVSGVDLNDEATNLMVYQKAYTAACRLMTTLEEALDALMAM
ncbi:MAG TPA: flagellar hook-associated protein FlgK [Candidatus Avoscillospira avistercoris]|uniref:Flagellar hook-associated protein 1 n=1 Tax=Candidatus Avoscillospira avistercoris TaxID=2840707 RepID=A0A9D1FB97_9FIRM|nr:flagellar hook-associated protein FlgK [Candidatus Avoscillospira avistercoris]